jgi:hypothetical protein
MPTLKMISGLNLMINEEILRDDMRECKLEDHLIFLKDSIRIIYIKKGLSPFPYRFKAFSIAFAAISAAIVIANTLSAFIITSLRICNLFLGNLLLLFYLFIPFSCQARTQTFFYKYNIIIYLGRIYDTRYINCINY